MIDETGKRVWEETFDLWGKPHDHLETRVVGGAILTNVKPREANKNQAISQPFRFPGQYHDEETGLYYNRYRYYMPNEGMYTQRDPIGLAGGNPTTYGYVKNTLSQIDPFGLAIRQLPSGRFIGTFNELRNAGLSDSHHIIQDATVRNLPGYDRGTAPAIQLDGPSTSVGSEHHIATQVQSRSTDGGTLGSERKIAYRALREAGLSREDAKAAVRFADEHFENLGFDSKTQTRRPGNRRKPKCP